MIFLSQINSPVGPLTAACTENAVCGLWFENARFFLYGFSEPVIEKKCPLHDDLYDWLQQYFAGKNPEIDFPIILFGTAFQRLVWDELRNIPYGTTCSYGDLAKSIATRTGRSTSARAVGGAVGRNPLSIVVPCHRVVGADGSLTGFGGGLERKRFLLQLETE